MYCFTKTAVQGMKTMHSGEQSQSRLHPRATKMNRLFVPDPVYIWLPGDVIADDGREVVIKVQVPSESDAASSFDSRNFARDLALTFPVQANISTDGSENMCELDSLNEASILENLRRRFLAERPYTFCNGICFAVNPQQSLKIYGQEIRSQYVGPSKSFLPAHVYATSMSACHSLFTSGNNQSIIVSGESGAGKTETVKVLMHHIAEITEPSACNQRSPSLFHKVLTASPLLESFGNAKTVRNDNSSRVGKFLQLDFHASGRMLGSKCQTFLLEKSRVTKQAANERNFHVFYEMLAGPEQWKRQLELEGKTAAHFRYTQGPCKECEAPAEIAGALHGGSSDGAHHLATLAAFAEVLYLSEATMLQLYSVLAAVLFLGQISFPLAQSEVDRDILPEEVLTCAKLLRVPGRALAQALMCGVVDVQGTRIHKELLPAQAAVARDALAKEIYARLFQWLVDSINHSTLQGTATTEVSDAPISAPVAAASTCIGCPAVSASIPTHSPVPSFTSSLSGGLSISLLDIFGFECFDKNAFEQLCINFANEKLQRKFAQDVIQSVQAEYAAEGIRYDPTPFRDNSAVLQLLEGRQGIFELLNEECVLPGGNETAFLSKLRQVSGRGRDASTSKHRKAGSNDADSAAADEGILCVEQSSRCTQFSVRHYAGSVTYEVEGFLAKNQDCVLPLASELLAASANPLLAELFNPARLSTTSSPVPAAATAQKSKQAGTIVSKFRAQLNDLMRSIEATQVQYVRCIKPNASQSCREFDRRLVVAQLRSGGLVEAVRVSRAAFPHKLSHDAFLRRYGCLFGKRDREVGVHSILQQMFAVELAMNAAAPRYHYQVGATKIFIGDGALQVLDQRLHAHCNAQATCIQRRARGIACRVRYAEVQRAVRTLQRAARLRLAWLQLSALKALRAARLQRCFTLWVTLGKVVRRAAVRVQARLRSWRAVVAFRAARSSVRKIQALYRGCKQRRATVRHFQCAQTQTELAMLSIVTAGPAPEPRSVVVATMATQTDLPPSPRPAARRIQTASIATATATATAATQTEPVLSVEFYEAAAGFHRAAQELREAFACTAPRSDAEVDRLLFSAVLVLAAAAMAAHNCWWVQLGAADRARAVDAGCQVLYFFAALMLFRVTGCAVKGNVMMIAVACAVASVV